MLRHPPRHFVHARVGNIPNAETVGRKADLTVTENRPHLADLLFCNHTLHTLQKLLLADADFRRECLVRLGDKRKLPLQEADDLTVERIDLDCFAHRYAFLPASVQLKLHVDLILLIRFQAHQTLHPGQRLDLPDDLLLHHLRRCHERKP